jgi:hypothetical protein
MADLTYCSFWDDLFRGAIDLDTDTFWMMLTTSSYVPSKATHTKRSDVTNEVAATGGYTAGGILIPTLTVTKDTVNNRQLVTFGSVNWAASTITARYGIIYKRRGGASSADELVLANDFGANIVTSSQTFVVAASVAEVDHNGA